MSALDTAASIVPPDQVRAILRQSPEYVKNRNRVGAILADGLGVYNAYIAAKPALFVGSLVGAAASGYAFEMRGRRKKNTDAMILYGGLFALCAAVAFITRPVSAEASVPEDAPPGTPPSPQGATVNWLDRRVAAKVAEDPNFADQAFLELVQMPGIDTEFQRLNPLIQAAVV